MTAFILRSRAWLTLIDTHLQVFLFGLMCIGLVIASVFVWFDMISGDNWVTVCGILFGSNAIGGSITQFARSKSGAALAMADDGNDRAPNA